MKRILISAVAAGALLGQLGAAEIYKDGDKSFGVFGTVRGIVGYGHNFSNTVFDGKTTLIRQQDEFIYGIQNNTRIGVNFTLGKLFGAGLIGIGEATFRGRNDTAGFRQIYAGYDFDNAGKLLVGKNELITSMAGFSSSIFDTDSGLQGFGGTSTSTRRFQIAYSVAGLTFSISENDAGATSNAGRGYEIPRFSLGYEHNADGLRAKIAASYTHVDKTSNSAELDAAVVTAGAKAGFGASYVSGLLTYGFNAEKIGEGKIGIPALNAGYRASLAVSANTSNTFGGATTGKDTNLVGVALEFGHNLTDDLAVKVGGGYQYTKTQYIADPLHNYAAFVQLPYSVGKGFSIIPQVGYLGTTVATKVTGTTKTSYANVGNVLAEVQLNFTF